MTKTKRKRSPEEISPEQERLYSLLLVGIFSVVMTAFLVLGYLTRNVGPEYLSFGWSIITLVALYAFKSIQSSNLDQLGAVVFLGKPLYEVSPGPHIVPWGLCELKTASTRMTEKEIPGSQQNIWYGDEKDRPEGKVSPLRITTAGKSFKKDDDEKDKSDPLRSRMTVEPTMNLRFMVKRSRGNFIKFLRTIGSMEEAEEQLVITLIRVVTQEYSRRTPVEIIAQLAEIQNSIRLEAEILVGDRCGFKNEDSSVCEKSDCSNPTHTNDQSPAWGVDIREAAIQTIGLSHELNRELRNLPIVELQAAQTRVAASAERFKLAEEGRGRAAAEKALMKELGVKSGEALLVLQNARALAEGSRHSLILPGGSGDSGGLSGLVQSLAGIKLDESAKNMGEGKKGDHE